MHLPTLLFVAALVVAFSGGLLLLAKGPQPESGAISIWSAAMLVGALGFVLVAAGPLLPGVPGGFAIGTFLAATALSWTAARVSAGQAIRPWLAAAGPTAYLASTFLLQGSPAFEARLVALACGIGTAYTLAAALEIGRPDGQRLPSRGAALALLLGHATIYGARCASALLGLDDGTMADTISAGLLLESMLHAVGTAFLLLSMVRERVELRTSGQLRALAMQDGLTGIGNRRRFDEELAVAVRTARHRREPLSLLLVDVDHFKSFNDAFGHPEGDACLRAIAGTVARFARRPGSLAARYGGEEFALLLPGVGLLDAERAAEALRIAVTDLGVAHYAPPGVVTVSIGAAALYPAWDQDTAAVLVQTADQALYDAKAGGRNCVRTLAGVLAA